MKKPRLYNLLLLQTDIWGKNSVKKRKYEKHTCYLKIINSTSVYSKEKTPTELPKLKRNKELNT